MDVLDREEELLGDVSDLLGAQGLTVVDQSLQQGLRHYPVELPDAGQVLLKGLTALEVALVSDLVGDF